MNYEDMSDIAINAHVSRTLYGDVSRGHQMELASGAVDYCNRIEDAWPIIEENNISLILDNPTMPCATSNARDLFNDDDTEVGVAYDKPLRAAMIVFLKMQETKE